VVAYFESNSWEVYQEVSHHGGVADIVVTRGPVVGVVEAKNTLSLHLIGQARRWVKFANLVWVAVPEARERSHQSLDAAKWVCETLGLGLITLNRYGVREQVRPPFLRKVIPGLKEALLPQHKQAVAGSPAGTVWTPYKHTCQELLQHVRGNPGVTLKAALKAIKHHYRKDTTARTCMARNIDEGIVPGVSLRRENGELKLYPA